ncbi:MAG: folylpolyglutamate synthase/dihydrofolate synthase family protein [Bacillota bacterium]|jgi:dihydrofolate synthase/folylpolyglutamate synthase|nr:folylpolyglutamate synthase/dihydrofolate synthase family protein [Bacillota bacterium]
MTYKEARDFIEQTSQYGSVLGLTNIKELMKRLDNPQDKLRIIHIAGTNGKGSVGAFLASILSTAGYRVGRYISPTVFSYRERIQISEIKANENSIQTAYITRQGVEATIDKIKPQCDNMVLDGFSHPTTFEIETAMTFLYLLWEEVDFVILEVGMGGRLDATNLIKNPVCTVFTSISMDHMEYLGDSIEKIALEKSGIIKPGSPVVTIGQEDSVLKILETSAKENKSSFFVADPGDIENVSYSLDQTSFSYPKAPNSHDYLIHILGKHQIKNAILAIEVANTLSSGAYHIDISKEDIFLGLHNAKWSGRFEILDREPYLLIDGAHNEEAALVLRDSIETYFTNRRLIFIIGILKDKDYKSILSNLAPMADTIITITPNNLRALSSEILAREARVYCDRVIDGRSVDQALNLAYDLANKEDVIIGFGSLSFLKDIYNSLKIIRTKKN